MENIQSMEFRHIRQLVHSVLIHVVKFCPLDMWEVWLEKLLNPLFIHCQQVLSSSWSSLMHEGRAKVPDIHGIVAGSDLKVEVMEEKLLRDLTREICSLLSTMASSGLNNGIPPIEQSGHFNRVDVLSLKDLDAFASNSMVGYVAYILFLTRIAFSLYLLEYFYIYVVILRYWLIIVIHLQFPLEAQRPCPSSIADFFRSFRVDRR